MNQRWKIGVIGLGYVGLPLAVEFATKYEVIGFDINQHRISNLKNSIDLTNEVSTKALKLSKKKLIFTNDICYLEECNFYVVTVPTPIHRNNKPDLSFIKKASSLLGKILARGDIVVYESTVYPGATREVCIPLLEKNSKLQLNTDFYVGYSPERINPGDKNHRISDIQKIVSGSNKYSSNVIQKVYSSIIKAGTYLASSIEVAEAAKVIENTQRDLNIALMNELSIIFNKMSIDTQEVIKAASTKWNFAEYYPGFVGGHCIGVDPYYLTFKAQKIGHVPKVILGGRNLNDSMPKEVAKRVFAKHSKKIEQRILIMGYTFKENCPDTRNTKIRDLEQEIKKIGHKRNIIHIYDPWIHHSHASKEFPDTIFIKAPKESFYNIILLAVGHREFIKMGAKAIKKFMKSDGKLWDLKYLFPKNHTNFRL